MTDTITITRKAAETILPVLEQRIKQLSIFVFESTQVRAALAELKAAMEAEPSTKNLNT